MGNLFDCEEKKRKSKNNEKNQNNNNYKKYLDYHPSRSSRRHRNRSYGSTSLQTSSPTKTSDNSKNNSPPHRGKKLHDVNSPSYFRKKGQPTSQYMGNIQGADTEVITFFSPSESPPFFPTKSQKNVLDIVIPAVSDQQNKPFSGNIISNNSNDSSISELIDLTSSENISIFDISDVPLSEDKWLELADEIWVHIGSFLSLIDIHHLQAVCRTFHRIFTEPLLHSQLIKAQYGYTIITNGYTPSVGYKVLNYFEQKLKTRDDHLDIMGDINNFNTVAQRTIDSLAVANKTLTKLISKLKRNPQVTDAVISRLNEINLTNPHVLELFLLHDHPDSALIKMLQEENLLPDYNKIHPNNYFEEHSSALFPFSLTHNFIDWLKTVLTLKNIKHPDIQTIIPLLLDCMTKHFAMLFKADQLWAAIPLIAINLLVIDNADFDDVFSWLNRINQYCSLLSEQPSSSSILALLLFEIKRFYPDGEQDDLCRIGGKHSILSNISETATHVCAKMSVNWNGNKATQPDLSQIKTTLENYQPTFYSLKKNKNLATSLSFKPLNVKNTQINLCN